MACRSSLLSSRVFALSFLFLTSQVLAQTPSAPPPPSSGKLNLTEILTKNGQYSYFIERLISTHIDTQIANQLNNSADGMTVFAFTDNAFNSLNGSTWTGLSTQAQTQLMLYHVLPKYYTLSQFLTVSNPVQTQASGQNGSWGLNFTGQGTQVNVSTGVVVTQINNALSLESPLAVYSVDQVLLPYELFGTMAPASAPASPPASAPASTPASAPPPSPKTAPSTKSNKTDTAPMPTNNDGSDTSGGNLGLGLVLGCCVLCIGALFT